MADINLFSAVELLCEDKKHIWSMLLLHIHGFPTESLHSTAWDYRLERLSTYMKFLLKPFYDVKCFYLLVLFYFDESDERSLWRRNWGHTELRSFTKANEYDISWVLIFI